MSLLLHPQVRRQIEEFIVKPSHALMLTGPEGSGKRTLALEVAANLLGLKDRESVQSHPYSLILQPEDGSLSIQHIRRLNEQLHLKTIGKNTIRRAIIIDSAHTLTIEAQNALLKTLEEPPADTVIILNVAGQHTLRPTIYSRAQQIVIKPIDKPTLLKAYADKKLSSAVIDRAFYISEGRIGLFNALLAEDMDHPLVSAIDQAKHLLRASIFERLSIVNQLPKDKSDIVLLLDALRRVVRAALAGSAESGKTNDIIRRHSALAAINSAQSAAAKNANAKLLLTDLSLNL